MFLNSIHRCETNRNGFDTRRLLLGFIRVSIGTAAVLRLSRCMMSNPPTTAYLLMYSDMGCSANCTFCPQAKDIGKHHDRLSRVIWPTFPLESVCKSLHENNDFKRLCVQTLYYPGFFHDLLSIISDLREASPLPLSISCQPLDSIQIQQLSNVGVDNICIPLDATTPHIFDEVKGKLCGGPYRWVRHMHSLRKSVQAFGRGHVYTHLIVGLGETEFEASRTIQYLLDISVIPGLFAFTPVPQTPLEDRPPPPVESYRRIQLARHLIKEGIARFESMKFNGRGETTHFGVDKNRLKEVISTGEPFITSGCTGCNRPYYNESPKGPIYNYPQHPESRSLDQIMSEMLE